MMVTDRILEKAIEQAEKVSNRRYAHGCVIFRDNQIVSLGYNMNRRVPRLYEYGYTRNCKHHAETHALLKANPDELVGSSILVVRKGKTKLCNSKPCSTCMSLIVESGIDTVYYSTKDGDIEQINI